MIHYINKSWSAGRFGFGPSDHLGADRTDDMDINCGEMLEGVSLEAKRREMFDTLLRVALGERTKSERLGYGDAEFVTWQIGAVM